MVNGDGSVSKQEVDNKTTAVTAETRTTERMEFCLKYGKDSLADSRGPSHDRKETRERGKMSESRAGNLSQDKRRTAVLLPVPSWNCECIFAELPSLDLVFGKELLQINARSGILRRGSRPDEDVPALITSLI